MNWLALVPAERADSLGLQPQTLQFGWFDQNHNKIEKKKNIPAML